MADKDLEIDLNSALNPQEGDVLSDGEMIRDMYNQAPQQTRRGNILAGQTMVLKGLDGDTTQLPALVQDIDKEATYQQAVTDKSEAVLNNAQNILDSTLGTDADSFEATAAAVQEQLAQSKLRQEDTLGAEREYVDSVTTLAPINVDDLVKEQEAVRLAVLNDVAKLLDNQSILDMSLDFTGFLVPFGLAIDQSDVLDAKFDWTNATDIERFVLDFQRLPAERKLAELPGVTEAILTATGTNIAGMEASEKNILKAAGILISLVSAEGAEEQGFQRNLDILAGLVDVGGPALAAIKGVAGSAAMATIRGNNGVKKIKTLGDTKRAAQLNIYALEPNIEDELATGLARELTGLNRQQAATNAMPIARDSLRPEWVAELAPEVSRQLNALSTKADGVVHSFLDESVFIKEGLLRKPEKELAIANTISKLTGKTGGRDVLNEGVHIDNVKVVSQNETGFTISYDMRKEGELVDQITATRNWSRSDVTGSFTETVENAKQGFEYGVSPAAWAHSGQGGDFLSTFKSASNLADLAAASQASMLDLLKVANKTKSGFLSPGSRKKVSNVEIAGDEFLDPDTGIRGKTFSPDELLAGVHTQEGTVRLTSPAEMEAYYKHRIFADTMAQLENHSARRQLEILGFDSHITMNGGEQLVGKALHTREGAKASIRNKQGLHYWDGRTGESLALTDEAIEGLYEDGFMMVRTMDDAPVTSADGIVEYFDYVAVRTGDIKRLPQKVIHTKEGYVPKINKGVEFLVKEHVPGIKHGSASFTRAVTHRFFASQKDADAYRAERVSQYLKENVDITPEQAEARFSTVADRELTPMQRLKEASGSSGGLFTGVRSSNDIVTGLKGVKTDRLSPLEAFQRNAQHIGSIMSRNEWRLGEEQRWLNTVEHYGFKNQGFDSTNLPDTRIGRALEQERNLIKQWSGVPTSDESFFEGVIQNMHDWMLTTSRRVPGLKEKDSVKSMLWLKHKDPAAALKGAVFHLALGVWNPAQLFVQGSAAAVALARFPKSAPQSLGYAFRLAATDRMDATGTAARVSKLWSDDATPIFQEVRLAWERSGLRESIRQNADLVSADSYGAVSMNSFKRLSDASMVLYRAGELFNRRVSFTASYLKWKRSNPGLIPDNEALKGIKADANLSMLELNHANRAMWQGGPDAGTFRNILGVMTQFQQVGAKSTELLIKGTGRGGFSTAEKSRIMLSQFGLWGAAGVPLGNAMVGEMVDGFGIEMDPQTREAWNQGILGSLAVYGLGSEIEIAPRLAPFGQLEQLVRDLLFDDVALAERMFGVAGSIGGRVGEAFHVLKPMVTASFDRDSVTWSDLLMGASVLAEVPSSSRGVIKSYIMHNMHKIIDRHGNIVVSEDFNLETEFGAALGFRPIAESETRQLQLSNLDSGKVVQEATDVALDLYWRYLETVDNDPKGGEKLKSALNVLFSSLANPLLEQEVRESMERKIGKGGSLRDRELKKFFERTLPSKIDEGATALRQGFFSNAVSTRAVVQPFENGEEE